MDCDLTLSKRPWRLRRLVRASKGMLIRAMVVSGWKCAVGVNYKVVLSQAERDRFFTC